MAFVNRQKAFAIFRMAFCKRREPKTKPDEHLMRQIDALFGELKFVMRNSAFEDFSQRITGLGTLDELEEMIGTEPFSLVIIIVGAVDAGAFAEVVPSGDDEQISVSGAV